MEEAKDQHTILFFDTLNQTHTGRRKHSNMVIERAVMYVCIAVCPTEERARKKLKINTSLLSSTIYNMRDTLNQTHTGRKFQILSSVSAFTNRFALAVASCAASCFFWCYYFLQQLVQRMAKDRQPWVGSTLMVSVKVSLMMLLGDPDTACKL
ncbi:hypothetical protein DY000_02059213 [Brassica cretica]|uniref:Uncharacterized protein n=1 Tax=Brassica cretica TaxID=69181 RepID=A0ABQ7B3H8_BRACR|nr:hypothetical protein DY000_02059213 [Brassica cretica]